MKLNWTERIELTDDGVAKIRSISGVYRLIYYDSSRKGYYVHYVGQADDLKKRLSEHLEGNEKNECCKKHLQKYYCYFRAAVVTSQSDRDAVEVALYNHFSPTCSEKVPNVEPATINFV